MLQCINFDMQVASFMFENDVLILYLVDQLIEFISSHHNNHMLLALLIKKLLLLCFISYRVILIRDKKI